MGKTKRAKQFAAKKRLLNPKDGRINKNRERFKEKEQKKVKALKEKVNEDLKIKEM
jgi:hypothetical protein